MSRLTLFREVINTLCPLVLIWAVLREDWGKVLPIAVVILAVQSVGLAVYLRDYYAAR